MAPQNKSPNLAVVTASANGSDESLSSVAANAKASIAALSLVLYSKTFIILSKS